MNKKQLFVLSVFAVIIIASMLSLVNAASIVRTSGSSGSNPYIQAYAIETTPSCSTIGRSHVSSSECSRGYIQSPAQYQPVYQRPRTESSFSATRRYAESPGLERYPQETTRMNKNAQFSNTNFDTASSAYDYRGPLFERRIVSSDDFMHENSAKSGFFSSRNMDLTTRSIRNEVIEKYVGASESLYTTKQNNQVSAQSASDTSQRDFDGGFSFGKQRLFDESEYAKDTYTQPYYYRPAYNNGHGYYNWRY
jgi:hypothetical protein